MTIICTGQGVDLFRLISLRGAVRLESVGLKHSKIRSVRKMAALEMGLKANAKFPEVLAALDKKIKEVKDVLKPGEVEVSGQDAVQPQGTRVMAGNTTLN